MLDELRSLVLKDQLPLVRLLQAEPLQMQAFHLSFQEFYAMCALRDGALELPQFHWEVWWSNAVHMGVQTGAKFGDAFADAAGLQRSEASEASEPSEAWRARIVAALVKEGLPSPWLATVVEAARGDRTDAAQLKAFVGRHRDILKREGTEFLACYPRQPLIEAAAKVGIRPILCRQERMGIAIADGFSRTTDGKRIGVFCMQQGPGTENSFPGVAQAFSDNVPVLLIPGGEASEKRFISPNFSAMDNFRHVTKWLARVDAPDRIPALMRRAFYHLRTGKPGPVLLEVNVLGGLRTHQIVAEGPGRLRRLSDMPG